MQIQIHPKEGSISPIRGKEVALLVVLGFVIVLSVLAAAFTTNMQVEAILARNSDAESDVIGFVVRELSTPNMYRASKWPILKHLMIR